VSKKELLGKCRRRDIVRSRNILHNVLNEKYKMNLTNIGRIFGQDHTTVLYSIQMKFNKTFYWDKNQTIWEETKELFI
jgi:chromosomal replication initiator protein